MELLVYTFYTYMYMLKTIPSLKLALQQRRCVGNDEKFSQQPAILRHELIFNFSACSLSFLLLCLECTAVTPLCLIMNLAVEFALSPCTHTLIHARTHARTHGCPPWRKRRTISHPQKRSYRVTINPLNFVPT